MSPSGCSLASGRPTRAARSACATSCSNRAGSRRRTGSTRPPTSAARCWRARSRAHPGARAWRRVPMRSCSRWCSSAPRGQRYADYLSEALWRRLGAADAWLWLDHAGGTAHADCCMFARQGDWIRVAQLLVRDGNYRGEQLIRPGWVSLMRVPAQSDADFGSFVRLAARPAPGSEPYAAARRVRGRRAAAATACGSCPRCSWPSCARARRAGGTLAGTRRASRTSSCAPPATTCRRAPPAGVSALVPGH